MQFGQLLTHLDTTQQMIANSLKDNKSGLAVVSVSGWVLDISLNPSSSFEFKV